MELVFLCDTCGKTKNVEDPLVTHFPCSCGGILRISSVQQHRRQDACNAKVNPNDEKTTLMDTILETKKPAKELSESLYRYKVAMCPNCGWIQVTEAEKCLKCRRCNKISTFRRKGQWNVRLKSFPTHETACMCAKEWSMEEGKNVKKR